MGKEISIDLVAYGILSHRMEIIERVKSWKVDIDGENTTSGQEILMETRKQ